MPVRSSSFFSSLKFLRLWRLLLIASLVIVSFVSLSWGVSTPSNGGSVSAQVPAGAVPSGDVIVVFKSDATDPQQVAQEQQTNPRHVYRHAVNGFSANLTEQQVRALLRRPDVAFVSPSIEVHAAEQTIPTGVQRVGADQNPIARIDGVDERVNADIAIIDSGIDLGHPDLNVVGGVDCTRAGTYSDAYGHGTHVAGIAAAIDNSSGVVGVAPGARLWAVRVLNAFGSGSLDDVLCGLDWVIARADLIDVVNMSIEGTGTDISCTNDAFHLAICNTVNAGIPVVVAAGNSHINASNVIPAAYKEVVTVSAFTDNNGQPGGGASPPLGCLSTEADDTFLTTYSNYGPAIDIAAPGTCILSTVPGGGLGYRTGTSMAAPHVTGAVALFKSVNPGASPDQVKQWLLGTAQPQDGPYGFTGDVDGIPEPVLWLGSDVLPEPPTSPDSGSAFAEQSGMVTIEAEHAHERLSRFDHAWYERIGPVSFTGFSGTSFMRVEPDNGTYWATNYTATAPEMQYLVNFETSGVYYVWVRAWAENTAGDSLHVGLDGVPQSTASEISVPITENWVWTRSRMNGSLATMTVAGSGQHVLNIWGREDGLRVDRILLATSSSYVPSGIGPAESFRVDDVPPTPTVTFNTTSTTVNVWARVAVTGYPASSTAQILWNGAVLESFQIDENGDGRGEFRVPATPFGFYPVTIVSGITSKTIQFEVKPRIKVIPGQASRGDTVDVSLRGFRKKEIVRIRWIQGNSWIELTQVLTSNTGSANVYVPVPNWVPDGPTKVRGDSTVYPEGGRAQTNAFVVVNAAEASTPTPTAVITPTPMIDTSPPFAEQDGMVVIEAEEAHGNISRGDHFWIERTDIAGFSGDGFMRVEPDNGWYLTSDYAGASPELQYTVEFEQTGTYYVWVRVMAQDGAANSLHVGLNGAEIPSGEGMNLAQTDGQWHWIQERITQPITTLEISTPGVYTVNVWMREDGLRLDRMLLTTDPDFVPEGIGPIASPRMNAAAASPVVSETPEITPSPTVTPTEIPTATAEPTVPIEPTATEVIEPTVVPEPTATEEIEPTTPPEPTETMPEEPTATSDVDASSAPPPFMSSPTSDENGE